MSCWFPADFFVQDYVKDLGVRARECGLPTDVLTAQANNGFAFVTEAACEKVLYRKKKELPEEGGPDQDRKTSLALACIAAIKPDLSAEDACKLINKGFIAENPDCYADLEVDEDILSDVVDKGEAKKMAEYTVELEKTKAKKSVVMHTREKCVGLYFKHAVAVKYTATQKKQPRWLPSQDNATTAIITNWIEKYSPADVAIECDDYNGRWRVIAPTLEWRSISWTKRGYEKAALEVIHQAWLFQTDWNGQQSPFSLEELATRFSKPD